MIIDFKILAKNERGELIEHKAHKIIIKQSPYFKGVSITAMLLLHYINHVF